MKATFEKTVDILVKAYLNDTLRHNRCNACAVGNLITASGYTFGADPLDHNGEFHWLAFIHKNRGIPGYEYVNTNSATQQIESTGYTWEELYAIESVFEAAIGPDRMFNGLMAVVDVLANIHGIDLEKKEAAKALFVK